jgi:dephospho-CoA kinase
MARQETVLAVVGMAGSGKSVVANALATERDAETVYFGGVVIEEIERRGLTVNESNEAKVRWELRQNHGMAAMAIVRLPQIMGALKRKGSVMIDGLYSYSEYLFLKEKLDERLVVVAVHAARRVRVERLSSRPVRPLTEQEVFSRDRREIEELEKGGPIALADYHIVNDSTIEVLHSSLLSLNAHLQERLSW